MTISEYCSPHNIITEQNHRSYTLPDLPWVSTQRWEDVLFLHWPLPPDVLRAHIPRNLQLDLYDGAAWIGLVFFQVKGMRLRMMPVLPWISSYLQLNVRTYVTYDGVPGVYFLSLHADSRLACSMAKALYSLPFRKAYMKMEKEGDGINIVSSRKKGQLAEGFSCSYTPVSSIYNAQINTFDHWLLERYCLWNIKNENLCRTDIHHTKWQLQKAEAIIRSNTMLHFWQPKLLDQNPIVHYSPLKQALFWLPVIEKTKQG